MQAAAFVLLFVFTVFLVLFRRLSKGPLHDGWSFTHEVVVETMRRSFARGLRLPVETMRQMPSGRIHPGVGRLLTHAKGTLAELPTEEFTPKGWTDTRGTLLYFHGGGYVVCAPRTHRDLISRLAVESGARAVAVDYRLAPEHPFPAAVDDCFGAYRALLDRGVPAERIALGGDSAGGGLVLAVLQRARGAQLAMPRAAILLSPWCDLEGTEETIRVNAKYDYIQAEGLAFAREQYLKGQDPRHPHASAVHADFSDFPPLLMQTGGAEALRGENEVVAARALAAGVKLRHEIEPGMVHVFQVFATFLPEGRSAIRRLGEFVREHVGSDLAVAAAAETAALRDDGALAAGQ